MYGVVFEHVGDIIDVEQVVDADDLDVGVFVRGAEDQASNPTEPVDSDFDAHSSGSFCVFFVIVMKLGAIPFRSRRESLK
jgi:hypothetical protein